MDAAQINLVMRDHQTCCISRDKRALNRLTPSSTSGETKMRMPAVNPVGHVDRCV